MKLIIAFFRLIRWPNLCFIALTQLLFYYCIIQRIITAPIDSYFNFSSFIYLVIASVLIAAAGYIINDYFDLNIDLVNKPSRLIIEKTIKRRSAILWHILFSLLGIALCFYIDFRSRTYLLGFANFICVVLLFAYSVALKKKLLIGNILIALLTAWVIMVVYLCYKNTFYIQGAPGNIDSSMTNRFTRMSMLYAGFAFVISLIREVVKDMEDREGDAKYGCKTIPIIWGIPAAKVFVAVWIIVLTGILGITQFYVLQFGWWWSAVYCFLLIILPLIWILQRLYKASIPKDYHQLSIAIKLVMFTGILSMIFFKIYP